MNLPFSLKRSADAARFLARGVGGLVTGFLLAHCATIRPVPVVAFTDHRQAMLYADLTYDYAEDAGSSGKTVVVPAGFVTDHASIPASLKQYFESGGKAYQYPAIVHDWLYWEQSTTREEADRIFNAAMEDCGVGDLKRRAIYAGVRAGGQNAWDQNRREKVMGLIKIIPEEHRNPALWPENVSWPQLRHELSRP